MTKYILLLSLSLSYTAAVFAQIEPLGIARYGQKTPPQFSAMDSLLEFSGGYSAFYHTFTTQFKFPKTKVEDLNTTEGVIGFTISLAGKVVDLEVIESVTPAIDTETMRLLSEMTDFQPQAQPVKLAVLYNALPFYLHYLYQIQKAERAQVQRDSIFFSKPIREMEAALDPTKFFTTIWLGVGGSFFSHGMYKYFSPTSNFSFGLDFTKKYWQFGGALTWYQGSLRRTFLLENFLWHTNDPISFFTFGGRVGYRFDRKKTWSITPLAGFTLGSLSDKSEPDPNLRFATENVRFTPQLGFQISYKAWQQPTRSLGAYQLVTFPTSFRVLAHYVYLDAARSGLMLEAGISVGFNTRRIFVQ